mgnify:CR=1 FL=1
MICEICKKNRIERVIAESKKAMLRFTKKLKEEKYEKNKTLHERRTRS